LRPARALGLKRVTTISLYTEAVDAAEHSFFAEGGIEAIAGAHLGIADGFRLAEPEAEAILDLAASAWDPQSAGLIAACLNSAAIWLSKRWRRGSESRWLPRCRGCCGVAGKIRRRTPVTSYSGSRRSVTGGAITSTGEPILVPRLRPHASLGQPGLTGRPADARNSMLAALLPTILPTLQVAEGSGIR
jgi:hypothetical protein